MRNMKSAIVHNDIKSPNILLDPTHTRGKLIDFTHSEEWVHKNNGKHTRISLQRENISLGLDNEIQNNVSVYWTCPEKYKVGGIQSLDKSIKCDMFSLGIVFWEMITRRLPFGGVRREELAIIGYKYATGERPEIPHANSKTAPASFIKTIENCIAKYYRQHSRCQFSTTSFAGRKRIAYEKDTRFGFHV